MIRLFLSRPIFASVLAIIIALLGAVSIKNLPIEQYPKITPPVVSVMTRFPGASAETISDSVAAPLEKALNGIENMIYMYSNSAVPGILNLDLYFEIDSDPNLALTNTQNRVNLAMASLPDEVRAGGVVVAQKSPNPLLFVSLESPNNLLDDIFVANYATIRVSEELQRIKGVASAQVFNAQDYSMRIWIDPDRLVQYHLTTNDVVRSVQGQSAVRSIGQIGQEPLVHPVPLTIPVGAQGRLSNPEEFENIVLKVKPDGATVFLKDVARVELGAQNYELIGKRNGKKGSYISVFQTSSANALEVASNIKTKMKELSQFFPPGLVYDIPYDNSKYISLSIKEVIRTIFEAAFLVSLVIFLFLHSIRATLVPVVAMFVSIVGTFLGLSIIGFSINTLSLFGLVLAVGIVVDDAIVVVEGVERHIRLGKNSFDAAIETMKEVSSPIIAITLVLCSVFLPVAFMGGIPGKFYQQFAVTIAISVLFSGFVSLTLSPVLSSILLKNMKEGPKWSHYFNKMFDSLTNGYLKVASFIIDRKIFSRLCMAALLFFIVLLGRAVPVGFIPKEDQGYLLISAKLPDGASISRVEEVSKKITDLVLEIPGVENVFAFSGWSVMESIQRSNMGTYYVVLKPWDERKSKELHATSILSQIDEKVGQIMEGSVVAFAPPRIPGIGVVGGFDFWVVDQNENPNMQDLNKAVEAIINKASTHKDLFSFFITSIDPNGMELFLDVDMIKTRALGVKVEDVYQTLQVLLGSLFINYFNRFGKVFQVVAQAESTFRDQIADIGSVFVRSDTNDMIPLKSIVQPKFKSAPTLASRFDGSPAALISVIPSEGGPEAVIAKMEEIAKETLPPNMSYSWGGIAYQQKKTGGASGLVVLGGFLVVFLVLAALYERWMLPLTVLFGIPFGIFGSLLFVWLAGIENNLYVQIGIIALIGLSAKNAILIVEFAKIKMDEGMNAKDAALEAAKLRFRPIIMTSLVFIFGSLPLILTKGAGAASRYSLGIGVVGGMLMATLLALLFIPYFFKGMEEFLEKRRKK